MAPGVPGKHASLPSGAPISVSVQNCPVGHSSPVQQAATQALQPSTETQTLPAPHSASVWQPLLQSAETTSTLLMQ